MANRRMIDPAFWESTKVAKLSMFERCLFLGIISNADDQGRMKAAMIRARVFPQDDLTQAEIQDGLSAIEAQQGIIRYTVNDDEFVQIRKWWDYQRPSWAWPSKYPAPPDWEDREKYRKGNEVTTKNWDESEPTPAPPPPEPEPEPMSQSAHSDPIVTPQRAHHEPIATSAPRDSGSDSESGSFSGRDSGKDNLGANAPPESNLQTDADYQAVRQEYIFCFPDKPKPRPGTKSLASKVRTRMKSTHFQENWRAALSRAAQSSFVQDGKWFDLGWFLHNDSNYEKCLNGNYDQTARASPRGSPDPRRVQALAEEMVRDDDKG